MKILFVTPYITSTSNPIFLKNQTGFGYMVLDIAKYVSRKEKVDMFTVSAMPPACEIEGVKILERNWGKWLKNFSLTTIMDGMSFLKKYRLPLKERLRTLYYFISIGQVERIVRNYDIVHIHGCSPITAGVIRACKRKHVPFLVTLHGLISFEQTVKAHSSIKQYERDFLIEAVREGYAVSFISTGNMNMASSFYENEGEKNILF